MNEYLKRYVKGAEVNASSVAKGPPLATEKKS